jgi:hypothetical protein
MTPMITHENRQIQTRSSVCVYRVFEAVEGGAAVEAESRDGVGAEGGSGGCRSGRGDCLQSDVVLYLLTYYTLSLYCSSIGDESNVSDTLMCHYRDRVCGGSRA